MLKKDHSKLSFSNSAKLDLLIISDAPQLAAGSFTLLKHFMLFTIFPMMFFPKIAVCQGSNNEDKYKADLIIFSYNRPTQLYALLESIEKYLIGIEETVVIYRTSNDRFAKGYEVCQSDFPMVRFVQQKNPPNDFKPILTEELSIGKAAYILFAVDDMIVKNHANLCQCTRLMEQFGAYAFFLRLGIHINEFQRLGRALDSSYKYGFPLFEIEPDIFCWSFCEQNVIGDWKYPNNVDMTVYLKSDVQEVLSLFWFRSPNTMEGNWAGFSDNIIKNKKGLCYRSSIAVNIPANLVQEEWKNPCMFSWSPQTLLEYFEKRLKIDITAFGGVKNDKCHMNYELRFIPRSMLF